MLSSLLAEDALFGANERGIILFGFEIYYYAIGIVCGILLATFLSALLMKRRNMSTDFIFTLFIFCIPSALLCARLYYCITDGMHISQWFSWDSIRSGGLSVIGGVLGGVTAGLVVCLVKKVNFFRAADCVVVTILVAQAMGRWGNFFNMEVYGAKVASDSMKWFPFAVPVSNVFKTGIGAFSDPRAEWHYAFFFYEMLLNLVGFGLLYSAAWFWNKKPNGVLMCGYFVWYGLVRSVMEPLRDPNYVLKGGGVPWSLVTSILMFVGGLAGIGVLLFLNYRKEGALIGSKRGDPCGITEYLTPYKDDTPYYSKINMMGKNYPPKPEKGKSPTPLPPSQGGGKESPDPASPVIPSEAEGPDSASPVIPSEAEGPDSDPSVIPSEAEGSRPDSASSVIPSEAEGSRPQSEGTPQTQSKEKES